jgi:hypothetical protein
VLEADGVMVLALDRVILLWETVGRDAGRDVWIVKMLDRSDAGGSEMLEVLNEKVLRVEGITEGNVSMLVTEVSSLPDTVIGSAWFLAS